jgi:hypothetical protein
VPSTLKKGDELMSKYIMQMRRGTRYVDDTGATLLNPDGTPVRDDWATYTSLEYHIPPLESELVVEYEENPKTGRRLPRLKIGDGISEFGDLEYISVDSFILPKPISVTLYADKWEQVVDIDGADIIDTYYQVATVTNAIITPNSKVDLQPNADQLCKLYDWGIALTTENNGGIIKVYAVGDKPGESLPIQATVIEVVLEMEENENE